jgi:hypothetical protein
VREIFQNIIDNHLWLETLCGSGSTTTATEPIRQALVPFLVKHNINSVLDAPCGDYSWMSLVDWPTHIKYIGADIVGSMIDKNKQIYPNIDFRQLDISNDQLPEVDLLFCRDCLFHFSFEDIQRTLHNIAKSNIKYVMLTSYHQGDNRNIPTGDFRQLKLTEEPLNFPPPIDSIEDWIPNHPWVQPRSMCLWPYSVILNYVKDQI